jgi:predicted ATPase
LEKGAALMQSSIEEMDRMGWTVWRPYMNSLLADPLRRLGRKGEAMGLIDAGLDQISRTGERGQEPEVHRVRGEVHLSSPDPDPASAEESFRKAVAISRKQKAKLYELRALLSLGRLLKDQGRKKEARKGLKKCYNWFIEGFEYTDLREARALMEELR